MLKGKSGNVDLLYCLSGIMATRNTLVVVVVMIMTRTTIITRLQELFAINVTDGAAFFPAIFFFFFPGVGGGADVRRCDAAVHRVCRRPSGAQSLRMYGEWL